MKTDNRIITVGQRVTFDDVQEGAKKGTVADIRTDLTNGCRTAWIEIDHPLPGIFWNVPVDRLQPLVSERVH